MEASGYDGQPKDFDALLRILDGELRLITPTDPEGVDAEAASSTKVVAGQKYYQLTHDYLVQSLRDWLTRKQKETKKGRAELRLGERAALWTAKPENRHLPAWWEWANIRLFTRKRDWPVPQKKMMRKAGRYHAVRGVALLVILALVGWGSYESYGTLKAHALRDRLLNANTTDVPEIVADMASYHRWIDSLLRDAHAEAEAKHDSRSQLHASLALLPTNPSQVDYLYGRLLDAQPQEVAVIRDAPLAYKQQLVDQLWFVVEQPAKGKESQRLRAASALATYDPDNSRWDKTSGPVVEQLVSENPVYLALWMEGFRPVRIRLLPSLAGIFKDRKDERTSERTLATNILVDYAADQPQMLADLVMDTDEKQFARLFPILKDHGARGLAFLRGELAKQSPREGREVFKNAGAIAQDDAKVKISITGQSLPAKVFEVPLQAGKTYHIAMDSKDPDSFLVLQDKSGKEIAFDDGGGGNMNALVVHKAAKDDTYKVYAASVKGTGSFLLSIVEAADENAKEKLAKRQANAAVAMLKMNQPEKVWPLLRHSPDPRVRSYLIHRFGPLGADAGAIVKRLDEEPDVTIRRALMLSLGEFTDKEFSPNERKAMLPKLQETYRTATDAGLHASAEWLLRSWKQDDWLRKVNGEWAKDKEAQEKRLEGIEQLLAKEKEKTPPQWYVNYYGETEELLPKYAWYTKNSKEQTWPVGSLKPNDLGLFDMQGNVFTWCQESYKAYPKANKAAASEDQEDGLAVISP